MKPIPRRRQDFSTTCEYYLDDGGLDTMTKPQ